MCRLSLGVTKDEGHGDLRQALLPMGLEPGDVHPSENAHAAKLGLTMEDDSVEAIREDLREERTREAVIGLGSEAKMDGSETVEINSPLVLGSLPTYAVVASETPAHVSYHIRGHMIRLAWLRERAESSESCQLPSLPRLDTSTISPL